MVAERPVGYEHMRWRPPLRQERHSDRTTAPAFAMFVTRERGTQEWSAFGPRAILARTRDCYTADHLGLPLYRHRRSDWRKQTVLAQHLGHHLDATILLDETDNPFVADLYSGRPGAAFQAQLFSLLARHRQQTALRQTDLFNQLTISDYLFDKDKIYAYLNLDDNELFIYQRLYDLLATDVIARIWWFISRPQLT